MSELKTKWPERQFYESHHKTFFGRDLVLFRGESYERARAEAALERLRVAVEALHCVNVNLLNGRMSVSETRGIISAALAAIGPIPESVSTGENQHE